MFESFILFKFYLKNINKYEKIIFQTRMATIGLTFSFLKWLPNTKLIFEARGAKNAELEHQGETKSLSLKSSIMMTSLTQKELLS